MGGKIIRTSDLSCPIPIDFLKFFFGGISVLKSVSEKKVKNRIVSA